VIGIDKGPKRFKTYINSKEKKNTIIFENGNFMENGMNSGTFRDNIPINDLGFEGNKNITIYSQKQRRNLASSIHNEIEINKPKRNSAEIYTNQDIKELRKQLKREIISELKERHEQRKQDERIKRLTFVPYEHKEFDEKQLNELD